MAKANPFVRKGGADARKGGAAPMPMKGAQPRVGKLPVKAGMDGAKHAPMHGKGMVAPPARKAK